MNENHLEKIPIKNYQWTKWYDMFKDGDIERRPKSKRQRLAYREWIITDKT